MKTYVLMTKTGEEEHLAEALKKYIDADFFVPKRKKLVKRVESSWTEQWQTLFPSYVFVSTNNIERLCTKLYSPQLSIGYFLVGKDENGQVMAVTDDELAYIHQLSDNEVSKAIKEGTQIQIISGSLKGMETQIKKVDPHKKRAWIDIPFLGETRRVEVALDIVKVIKE